MIHKGVNPGQSGELYHKIQMTLKYTDRESLKTDPVNSMIYKGMNPGRRGERFWHHYYF